jgi:dTMP kinase
VFVAFEGIDGSGKTALSNLVADRLRAAGREVVHARANGVLGSAVARRVRELTRDQALLEMSPRAELFLNLAREAQQLDEIVRPALAQGAVCIADRSLHTIAALAVGGRALPRGEVEPATAAAAGGLWPALAILVDVDPDVARLRRQVRKLAEGRDSGGESRKGLAGAGLQVRIRRHLLAIAAADPATWLVVGNEARPLEALAAEVAAEIVRRLAGGAPGPALARPPMRCRPLDRAGDPADVAARFRAGLAALAPTEPALAAYLLSGIPGPAEHALRAALAPRAPAIVARGLAGLSGPDTAALRRALADDVPADVALGLERDPSPAAAALRAELVLRVPGAVVRALAGDGSEEAWALRERAVEVGELGAVLVGLAGVDDPRAWSLRADGLARGLAAEVARSLARVAGVRADALRARLAEQDRLGALRATTGLDGPLARRLRDELFAHAPKRVLRSLTGLDAPYAWALRERGLPLTKEALDSVDGMDQPRAWALREAGLAIWPATAVSSLRLLVRTPRGRAVLARALATAPGSIAVLRNAHAAFAQEAPAARTHPTPRAANEPPRRPASRSKTSTSAPSHPGSSPRCAWRCSSRSAPGGSSWGASSRAPRWSRRRSSSARPLPSSRWWWATASRRRSGWWGSGGSCASARASRTRGMRRCCSS